MEMWKKCKLVLTASSELQVELRACAKEWIYLQSMLTLCLTIETFARLTLLNDPIRGILVLRRAYLISETGVNRLTNSYERSRDADLQQAFTIFRTTLFAIRMWRNIYTIVGYEKGTLASLHSPMIQFIIKPEQANDNEDPDDKDYNETYIMSTLIDVLSSLEGKMGGVHAEISTLARMSLIAKAIAESSLEYRLDRATFLKAAVDLLPKQAVGVNDDNDWIIYRWIHSLILRRLGRINEAEQELLTISRKVQGQARAMSPLLTCEIASIRLSRGDWVGCIQLLKGLKLEDEEKEWENYQIEMYVMLSAAYGMCGKTYEAVRYLEKVANHPLSNKSNWSHSWKLKAQTILQFRPHKRVLAYEYMYLRGILFWFDTDIAGTVRAGGKREAAEILEMMRHDLKSMHDEANVSVVYPDKQFMSSNNAAEELLTVNLIRGSVSSMHGELDNAEKDFKYVLDNVSSISAKSEVKKDMWHIPFATYELAVLEIRKGNDIKGRELLLKAVQLTSGWNALTNTCSFRDTLLAKCNNALRYLDSPKRIASLHDWKRNQEENEVELESSETHPNSEGSTKRPYTTSIFVPRKESFEYRKPVSEHEVVTWKWNVDHGQIGFSATFMERAGGPGSISNRSVSSEKIHWKEGEEIVESDDSTKVEVNVATTTTPDEMSDDEDEKIYPPRNYETGDIVKGFYRSKVRGVIKLKWDNTSSAYYDRKIQLTIETSKPDDF